MVAGTLQTLNFISPTSRNGVFLSNSFLPANNFRFPVRSPVFNPNSPLLGKSQSGLRTVRCCERSDKVQDNENKHIRGSNLAMASYWARPLLDFAATNFLPMALVIGVALGLANPSLGCLAHRYSLSKFSTFGIFVISGLMLRSGEIGAAREAWPAVMFGLGSILIFTPFFSRLICQLKLVPQEFVTGLAIFCCMPTTLSSGVTLTQLVGGNSALALAMTVISNLLGILIVPFSLSKFIAAGGGVSVPTKQLFRSLFITLLVPLILGKVFRNSFHSVAEYVDRNRKLFSIMNATLLSLVPWMQVSKSRSLLLMVEPAVFLVAIGMGTLLHLLLLAWNTLAVQSLSFFSSRNSVFARKENSRALVIVASQKTLPVMIAVVEQFGGVLGDSGLLVLPCVAAHINQIIIDSFLVNFWLWKDRSRNHSKEA